MFDWLTSINDRPVWFSKATTRWLRCNTGGSGEDALELLLDFEPLRDFELDRDPVKDDLLLKSGILSTFATASGMKLVGAMSENCRKV